MPSLKEAGQMVSPWSVFTAPSAKLLSGVCVASGARGSFAGRGLRSQFSMAACDALGGTRSGKRHCQKGGIRELAAGVAVQAALTFGERLRRKLRV